MEAASVKTLKYGGVYFLLLYKYCIECTSDIFHTFTVFLNFLIFWHLTSSPSPQLQLQTSWRQILLILDLFITPHWMMYIGIWLIYSWEPTHTQSDIRKYKYMNLALWQLSNHVTKRLHKYWIYIFPKKNFCLVSTFLAAVMRRFPRQAGQYSDIYLYWQTPDSFNLNQTVPRFLFWSWISRKLRALLKLFTLFVYLDLWTILLTNWDYIFQFCAPCSCSRKLISIQCSVNSDNVYSGSNKTCLESVSDPFTV